MGFQPKGTLAERLRRPVALALAMVAKRFRGQPHRWTITTINVGKGRLVADTSVGRKLADMCLMPDEKRLLVVDENRTSCRSCALARISASQPGSSVPNSPVSVIAWQQMAGNVW